MRASITKSNQKKHSVKNSMAKVAVILLWLLLWQFAFISVESSLLIPSPLQVSKRLCNLVVTQGFWITVMTSFLRIMGGFILGVFIGVVLAVLTSASKILHNFFYPALSMVKATPVASFIILALVWISSSRITTFMSFLMTLPIVWANMQQGIKKVDIRLLQMAKVYHLSFLKTISNIYIPSVLPFFVAACTTALGLSWKAGIAAEVLAIPKNSIGKEIYNSKIYLETVDLFAWTAVVIIVSVVIERILIKLIELMRIDRGVTNEH